MAARQLTGGRLIAAITIGVLVVGGVFGYIGISRAYLYATGEETVATVDDCETKTSYRRGRKRTSTTCYGSWTTKDGAKHTGEIDGAGQSDEGKQLPVVVKGDSAQEAGTGTLWPLGVFCVIMLGGAIGGLVLLSRRNKGGGSGPDHPPSGPPAPAYP
ncbi:MAG: hypothetical protein ACRDT4_24395, partial [Micromonosporaceae bacterium]